MRSQSKQNFSRRIIWLTISVLALFYSCKKDDPRPPKAGEESADVVYAWYKFIAQVQLRAAPQPVVLLNVRNFGFVGVGLYESVQPGIKGAVSLSSKLYQMPQMPQAEASKEYLWSASANAYLASMFKQILAGLTDADKVRIDSMETANNNRFKLSVSDAVINRSQSYGRAVASAIYNWSTTDNFNLSSTGFTLPIGPDKWVPTPPAFAAPVGAFLGNSRPFLAYSLTATAPPLPFPYSENPSSEFYQAAQDVYLVSKALTAEQKAIADWWADVGGSGVGVPFPYHLLNIITNVLQGQGAKLGKAAEMYAKTGIGMKDGHFITFKEKYRFNLLRPITYIQRHIDPTWQSYLVNPPYSEYPSGLSGLFAPPLQVLIREFGNVPVTDDTYVWRGLAPRQYASIGALIAESALSRVYGGLHFRFSMGLTVEMGQQLANQIADINLVPRNSYKK